MGLKTFGIISSFLIGLCFGSFLNSLVYRLAERKTILGRSYCPKCFHKLSWFENIPLLSFIFLRGKCRYCHQPISLQYPLVEFFTGLLFSIAFIRLSPLTLSINSIISLLIEWLVFFVLIFIFLYDLKYQEIEPLIVGPAIILISIPPLIHGLAKPLIISLAISFGFFLLQYLVSKGRGIGLGDVWVGTFMAVTLVEPTRLIVAIFFAYIIGSLVAIFLLICHNKKYRLKTKIPLAPFLVLGTLVAIFWGGKIISFYLTKL